MRVITDPDTHELWKSAIAGTIYLKRFDRKGDLIDEMVGPGKTVHVTPNERRLNQEMAAEPEYDFFTNGFLVPVRLIPNDDADSTDAFTVNANHLSEDDMKDLLEDRRATKKLAEALEAITNPMTLQRMVAVASDIDASVKQVESIKARMSELSGGVEWNETETVAGPDGPVVQTSAPNVEAPRNAGVGRRVARP